MTKELKALIEDLRLNHEYCPKEVILQAADKLERLAQPEREPDQKRPQNCGTGYCSCIECVMKPSPRAWLIEFENGDEELHFDEQSVGEIHVPLYTTPPQPEQEQPTDIGALVQGMEVSIDVSTGDHDAGHRLFGTVTLVQENQGSKHGLILLVQDPQPNFKAQRKPWVGLTDDEIQAVAKQARSKDHAVTLTNKFLKEKNT